jgi:hypothetical protein
MANDVYKTVNYSDGEGLTHGDLNNQTRFLAAQLQDQILGNILPNMDGTGENELVKANAATLYAYCLDVGGALPIQGSGNNKLKISPGTLFQKIANVNGNAPTLLAYSFDGSLEFTIAAGGGVNPRVDMIQMKLEYETGDLQSRDFEDAGTGVVTTENLPKQYRVKATVSLKTGTAAASPAYPAPDSGYVPICCVVVNASYTAANPLLIRDQSDDNATIHDLRLPVRSQVYTALPSTAMYNHGGEWSEGQVGISANSADGTDVLRIPCPVQKCRLLTAKCHFVTDTVPPTLARLGYHYAGALNNFGSLRFWDDLVAASSGGVSLHRMDNTSGDNISIGPTIDESAADYFVPIWGNGARCYSPNDIGGSAEMFTLALGVSAAASMAIYGVIWTVAEGI